MKKIIFMLSVLLIMTGCSKQESISYESTENHKTETEEKESTSEVKDYTDQLKKGYATEYVYRDLLNPLAYLVITDDEVIALTKTEDLEIANRMQKDHITSIDVSGYSSYNIITFNSVGENEKCSFVASNEDYLEIIEKPK